MGKFSFIFLFYYLFCNPISDNIDKILTKAIELDNKQIKSLSQNFKNDDNLLILLGLSEINGESSFNYFYDYMKKNPYGTYAELSIFKIAEYYYSNAEYLKSANWYKKIPDNFPASNKLETSIGYYLNALVISNKTDSARHYANIYKKKYPNIGSLNNQFLIKDDKDFKNLNKFSVKVGSYDKLSTALYYKNILQKEKFSVVIKEEYISNKIFYNLLVGQYKMKSNAINAQKRLLSRLGISDTEIIELN